MPIHSKLNFLSSTSFHRLVELFATQPAMLYFEGCGHKKMLQLTLANYSTILACVR